MSIVLATNSCVFQMLMNASKILMAFWIHFLSINSLSALSLYYMERWGERSIKKRQTLIGSVSLYYRI